MKKVTVKEEVFEQVKSGLIDVDAWETSDGMVFNDIRSAEHHEFYNCKVNRRSHSLPTSVDIFDFKTVDDLKKYEDDYCYNTQVFNYDKTKLVFPGTYVLHDRTEHGDSFGDDDEWSDYTTYTDIYTLDDWKELIIKGIRNIK